jgi:rhodanese-related sulfurtransferase
MLGRPIAQVLTILVVAAAAATVSNLAAGPERRLEWTRADTGSSAPRPVPGGPKPSPSPPRGTDATAAALSPLSPHSDRPYVEISGEQARDLFSRGARFFDARRSAAYREGHVAGAKSFSVWEAGLDDKIRAFFGEGVEPSAPLVVYCSGGECEDSHALAQKLYLAGFDDVLVYKDGFPDWKSRGLPVRAGDVP